MEMMRMMADNHGWISYWNLERRDVEGRHVVLAAAFVLVIYYVFPDIIVRIGILDLRFASSVVHDKNKNQDCNKELH